MLKDILKKKFSTWNWKSQSDCIEYSLWYDYKLILQSVIRHERVKFETNIDVQLFN